VIRFEYAEQRFGHKKHEKAKNVPEIHSEDALPKRLFNPKFCARAEIDEAPKRIVSEPEMCGVVV
jgi:hypothetical protein